MIEFHYFCAAMRPCCFATKLRPLIGLSSDQVFHGLPGAQIFWFRLSAASCAMLSTPMGQYQAIRLPSHTRPTVISEMSCGAPIARSAPPISRRTAFARLLFPVGFWRWWRVGWASPGLLFRWHTANLKPASLSRWRSRSAKSRWMSQFMETPNRSFRYRSSTSGRTAPKSAISLSERVGSRLPTLVLAQIRRPSR